MPAAERRELRLTMTTDRPLRDPKTATHRRQVAQLRGQAKSSKQLSKRLDAFNERVLRLDVSRSADGKGFTQQGLKKADFVNKNGEIECTDGRVAELLDALDGRFFGDGFSEEQRRADRFGPRR